MPASSKRIRVGKVFQLDHYEYICCSLSDTHPENLEALKHLYNFDKLEKKHILDLGLAKWNFYMKFGKTFEFMLQRIKGESSMVLDDEDIDL